VRLRKFVVIVSIIIIIIIVALISVEIIENNKRNYNTKNYTGCISNCMVIGQALEMLIKMMENILRT
jgi:hypothetical protein